MEGDNNGFSNQANFEIEAGYSNTYLSSNYEPERYQRLENILNGITIIFDEFLDTHEKYAYLRSIDMDKVGINDRVFVTDMLCTGIIMSCDNGIYIINVNGEVVETTKAGVKPVDEYINKLKIPDIRLLYTFIRDKIDQKIFSEIEYFYVFSEYFKINEKTLYGSLPMDVKGILLGELDENIGVFEGEKGVDNNW